MKWFVSRALLVGMFTESQLQDLHAREVKRGYCIPATNVCEVFHLGTMKDYYNVSDDPVSLRSWGEDMETEIRRKNLLGHEGDGFITELNVDATHSFDWGIWKNRAEIRVKERPSRSRLEEMVLN